MEYLEGVIKMRKQSDTKIMFKIAVGFIIFACVFIIPWVYGWYKILMG